MDCPGVVFPARYICFSSLSNAIIEVASLLRKKQTVESLSKKVYKTGVLQKCSSSTILEKGFEK